MKIFRIIFLLLMFFFSSCSKYLDINHNPNQIEELKDVSSMIPSIEMSIAYSNMNWDYGISMGIYNQYFTQAYGRNQFRSQEEYQIDAYTTFDESYINFYSNVLVQAKYVMDNSKENSTNALICELISIFTWQKIVDTWGNMPYFEALKGVENFSPKCDDASAIYNDLIKRINKVIENCNNQFYKSDIREKYDLFFAGDIYKWQNFANNLKLKLELRLSQLDSFDKSELKNFVENSNFLESDCKIDYFLLSGQSGNQHPFSEYSIYILGELNMSSSFISYLLQTNDPRLKKFTKALAGDLYIGALQGDFDYSGDLFIDDYCSISVDFNKLDLMLMPSWQNYFNIAEVYALNDDFANAKKYFEKAVRLNIEYWQASNDDLDDFIDNLFKDDDLESVIESISLQRWVAYYLVDHGEAFFEHAKNKYPALSKLNIEKNRKELIENFPASCIVESAASSHRLLGQLPSSIAYPQDVFLSLNVNAPKQKDNIAQKIFWDTKPLIIR